MSWLDTINSESTEDASDVQELHSECVAYEVWGVST